MDYDDLPDSMKEHYDDMRHQSLTLQTDVEQALNKAINLDDFVSSIESFMESIVDEARHVANVFTEALKLHKKSVITKSMKKALKKHKTEYGG